MFFRHKKNSDYRLALILSGLAFFAVMSAYIVVRLDATMHRPRELPLGEIGENGSQDSFVYYRQNTTDAQTKPTDEENWNNAEKVLLAYFENVNAGNYEAAIALRTPKYLVGSAESYVLQLKNSMEKDISGKLKITNIERITDASKPTTKYFRFQKDAVWSFDGSTHSEIKKAAIVERDGVWTIDYFETERKF
ncbi:MAG: hypothetical protein V2A63_03485 [Patescibacteria group bacterium]